MCSWERLDLTCDNRSDGSSSELAQRHSHAAVCVGSAVWIYGGFHGGALSDQLLELWPRDWSWRRRYASGPPATVLHTMVACLDQVILFGGLVQRESASMATNQLWLLDTTQCAWSLPATQGEPPSARVGHAAAVASSQPDGAALMCARRLRSLTLTLTPTPALTLSLTPTPALLLTRYVYGGYAPGPAEYLNDFAVPLAADVERGHTLQPHVSEAATLCISGALAAHVDVVTAAHLRRPLHAAALLLGHSHRARRWGAAIAGRLAA